MIDKITVLALMTVLMVVTLALFEALRAWAAWHPYHLSSARLWRVVRMRAGAGAANGLGVGFIVTVLTMPAWFPA